MFTKMLLDLDGTVYLGANIIDRVDEEIRRLHDAGVQFSYMTNNTSIATCQYLAKLTQLDLPVTIDRIISPTLVLAQYLKANDIRRFFSLGTKTFVEELQRLSHAREDHLNPELVIVAFDKELTYAKLEEACGFINRGIPYVNTNIDLACPSPSGPIPDCGAICKILEASTSVSSMRHFGKPGHAYVEHLRRGLTAADEVLVAGDRAYTDAKVGLALGVRTLLVRSGEFKGTAADAPAGVEVADTLACYLRELRNNRSNNRTSHGIN